jgi:hypothetical protein
MKNQVSTARTSSNHIFLRTIKKNHRQLLNLEGKLKKLKMELAKTSGDDQIHILGGKIQTIEDKLAMSSFIVIVFSALVLEAYIYDYAARHLTDAFVKDHLDRLDTFSKWIIVPELVTGKRLSQPSNWQGALMRLIKARNSVIHYKSSEPPASFPDMRKYLQKLEANSASLFETARQSIQLLHLLADKIAEADPEEIPWVNSYLI